LLLPVSLVLVLALLVLLLSLLLSSSLSQVLADFRLASSLKWCQQSVGLVLAWVVAWCQ
jgi:hypothetical protein